MIATPQPADLSPADLLHDIQDRLHRALGDPLPAKTYRLAGANGVPAQAALEGTAMPPDSHTPTVLLVEDDEATRRAMTSWLVAEGFSVLAAADGHEAAGHLERPPGSIDVVVLDVGLPDANGVDLCQRVRERYPEMPVVVCTGGAAPGEVARLVELGASRYFRKPVDPDELLSAVASAVN